MTIELEYLSINDFAKGFLSPGNISVPTKIHNALQNILTKSRDNENSDKVQFRKCIIKSNKNFGNTKHEVIKGSKNSIYNVLCLLYLIGTGETKKLFQDYYSTQNDVGKRDFSILVQQTKKQYLEFFCLGVIRENIDQIIECLHSTDFNLFTDKLPSPFSSNFNDNNYDLSPMLQLYEKDIPWKDYMDRYERAEQFFENKKYDEAKLELTALEQSARLRLPVVESLNRQIKAKEHEAQEAFDYLKGIL